MSVNEAVGFEYTDNGDIAILATGNLVVMKTDAYLEQLHWQSSELAQPAFAATVYEEDGTTQNGGYVEFWMDDVANLYADFTGAQRAQLHDTKKYYYVAVGENGTSTSPGADPFGYTFGDGISIPRAGTYLDWIGDMWDGLWPDTSYLFGVRDVTLELISKIFGASQTQLLMGA